MSKVKLSEAHSSVSKAAGTDNDLYEVQIGKTRLIWNGRAVGDSTAVGPIQESWLDSGTERHRLAGQRHSQSRLEQAPRRGADGGG